MCDAQDLHAFPTRRSSDLGLAFVCAARGYKLAISMPESMSLERQRLLKAFGAKLYLTPRELGMKGAIARATELFQEFGGEPKADRKSTRLNSSHQIISYAV